MSENPSPATQAKRPTRGQRGFRAAPRAVGADGRRAEGPPYRNLAAAMHGIPQVIIDRQLGHFAKVDPGYAQGVHDALATIDEAHETHESEKHMDAIVLDHAN